MPFAGLCLENKRGPSCSHISLGEEQLLPARPLLNKSSNCLYYSAILSRYSCLCPKKGEKEIEKKMGEKSHPKPHDLPSPAIKSV